MPLYYYYFLCLLSRFLHDWSTVACILSFRNNNNYFYYCDKCLNHALYFYSKIHSWRSSFSVFVVVIFIIKCDTWKKEDIQCIMYETRLSGWTFSLTLFALSFPVYMIVSCIFLLNKHRVFDESYKSVSHSKINYVPLCIHTWRWFAKEKQVTSPFSSKFGGFLTREENF